MQAEINLETDLWVPCLFLGIVYTEDDVSAVVQVNNSLVLKFVHPSRVRLQLNL